MLQISSTKPHQKPVYLNEYQTFFKDSLDVFKKITVPENTQKHDFPSVLPPIVYGAWMGKRRLNPSVIESVIDTVRQKSIAQPKNWNMRFFGKAVEETEKTFSSPAKFVSKLPAMPKIKYGKAVMGVAFAGYALLHLKRSLENDAANDDGLRLTSNYSIGRNTFGLVGATVAALALSRLISKYASIPADGLDKFVAGAAGGAGALIGATSGAFFYDFLREPEILGKYFNSTDKAGRQVVAA